MQSDNGANFTGEYKWIFNGGKYTLAKAQKFCSEMMNTLCDEQWRRNRTEKGKYTWMFYVRRYPLRSQLITLVVIIGIRRQES